MTSRLWFRIALLALSFVGALASNAYAYNYPANMSNQPEYKMVYGTAWSSSQQGACSAGSAFAPQDAAYGGWVWENGGCWTSKPGSHYYEGGVSSRLPSKCGPNDTFDGVSMCLDGNGPAPQKCDKTSPYTVTETYASVSEGMAGNLPSADGQCKIGIDSVDKCTKAIETGIMKCQFTIHQTGVKVPGAPNGAPTHDTNPLPDTNNNRTPIPPSKASPDDPKCPAGTVQGGFDNSGIPICVGTGVLPPLPKLENTKTVTPTTTTTKPDGTVEKLTNTTITNKDGSQTTFTDQVLTATDGSITTKQFATTTNTPAGQPGTSDNPADKTDLCKNNPTLAMCRNSRVDGTCGQITCQGDAIQCATLRAAAAMQCKQVKDDADLQASPLTTLGNQVISGTDPLKSTFPTVSGATVVQAPSTLDTAGWLGGRACFTDKVVTFRGQSITLPFSKSCDILLTLRYALMVAAALVSFRILSGAILT